MSLVVKLKTADLSDIYLKQEDVSTELTSSPVFLYFIRPCFVEFLGSLAITFLCAISPLMIEGQFQPLYVALANGMAITFLMGSFGAISGGHFNPSITLGVWLAGGMRLLLAVFYFICQLFGAFIGALLVRAVIRRNPYMEIVGGVTDVNLDLVTKGQAILLELVITFTVVITFLQVVVDQEGTNSTAPFIVGMSSSVGTLIGYRFTRASMSPARSLGTAVIYAIFVDGVWEYHYVYWVGPLIGAILAALSYRLILARDTRRLIFKT